ncbi:hypothetical protein J4231_02790 [Candidatus Woesearchaeota archaeon]|nr:hypothetical protein [Candidatus Woesearchaeota archaeon]
MLKRRTAKEAFEELAEQGFYEEANLDKYEVEKVLRLVLEDYEFGKTLRKITNPNWRVIFNINYDVLRELCSQLMRFKRQKISNHQGLFAFIILNFPKLEFDWEFLETVRNMRNQNKYFGSDISKENWISIELKIDLYISALDKEVKEKIKETIWKS